MTTPQGDIVLPVQWTLNGFTLTGYDPPGNWWVVQKTRGWRGTSKPRTDRTARPTSTGSYRGTAYRDERVISLSGTTRCTAAAARADAEDAIGALLPDGAGLVPLVRVGENGIAQVRYVELDDVYDPIPVNERRFSWDLQLAAPDPRKFAATWTSSNAPDPIIEVGGVVSTGLGVVSTGLGVASGTAGQTVAAVVTGRGAAPNPVVLQLVGPLGGDGLTTYIADTAGGATIRFRGVLGPGTSCFINCDSQPAHEVPGAAADVDGYGALIGVDSARSAIGMSGGWPSVPPGQARSYLMSGPLGAGSALIVHTRAAWD